MTLFTVKKEGGDSFHGEKRPGDSFQGDKRGLLLFALSKKRGVVTFFSE